MFTNEELALITYALILLKVDEQRNPCDDGKTLAETKLLIDKARVMRCEH